MLERVQLSRKDEIQVTFNKKVDNSVVGTSPKLEDYCVENLFKVHRREQSIVDIRLVLKGLSVINHKRVCLPVG